MSSQKKFVHLHVHTEYSLLDGAAQINKAIKKAIQQGAPALAMTDHGNMYGAIKFYNACKSAGIKPIIGTECYITENRFDKTLQEGKKRSEHLVLLAKNIQGYRNLCKLNSIGYIEGFYYNPRIDWEVLERHKEGLICLSACLAGGIPQRLMHDDKQGAFTYAKRLQDLFGDDFYIELQNHKIPEELNIFDQLIELANKIGAKYVATNDVHYVNAEDSEMHKVLVCMQTLSTIDNPQITYREEEFYMRSYDEMLERMFYHEEALETSLEIADKCNLEIPFGGFYIPVYQETEGMNPKDYLRHITYIGLERRYGKDYSQDIKDRADVELNVINSMGFENYFLIVWDFIRYAKETGIPVGPGRGSGAGSIVAYSIGITDVIDPLKFDLIFERFLNKDRKSMPDFDIDFCFNRRQEVIDYVKQKYGEKNTCQIITFGKLKKKQAFRDVCRVFNIPYKEVSRYTKFIIEDPKANLVNLITRGDMFEVPELCELYENDPQYKRILDICTKVEGFPRNTSMHAAGVVICCDDVSDHVPLARNGEYITTQYDKDELEPQGLIKMDFLGLKTLTDIRLAKDYVKRAYGKEIDFEQLGYSDPQVYKTINAGDLDTVFQLESGGMKKMMMNQLKPTKFEEIVAGIALYRPGPMEDIPTYCKNKDNPSGIELLDPRMDSILRETYGVIVYQEQAMFISRALSGFTLNQADELRSIIAKKKEKLMPVLRKHFIFGEKAEDGTILYLGAVNNGVSEKDADKIFENIRRFGSYAFNKSHAAAYAEITYETAWLHTYYPIELVCAVINNRIDNADEVTKYMQVLRNMGVTLLPPDINQSEVDFMPNGKERTVRFGLCGIKNVGRYLMERIVDERNKNGAYQDFNDFIRRANGITAENQTNNINKRMLESLIKGGALDCFGKTRATLLNNYENIIIYEERVRKEKDSSQFSFFDDLTESGEEPFEYRFVKEYNQRDRLNYEKEVLGMYVTGHPLAGYEDDFRSFNFNTSMIAAPTEDETEDEISIVETSPESAVSDNMSVSTGGIRSKTTFKRTKDGKEFGVFELEDLYGKIEVVMFSAAFLRHKKFLTDEVLETTDLVRIKGRLSMKDGDPAKIIANEVIPWNLAKKEEDVDDGAGRTMYFNLVSDAAGDDVMELLESNVGKCKVVMQKDGKLYDLGVSVCDPERVKIELSLLIGTKNIIIK